MSLIDNLRPKSGAKPTALTAPAIEKQLEPARARVLELDAAIRQAALDAASDDPAAVERYRKVSRDLADANERLNLLNQAYAGAVERDSAHRIAHEAELRRDNIAAIKRHIKARNEALGEMSDALEKAAKAFARALEKCEQAYACRPNDFKWPDEGTLISVGELRQMWMAELYRVSAKPGGDRALPGASAPDEDFVWQPANIRPATTHAKQATEKLFELLDKKPE